MVEMLMLNGVQLTASHVWVEPVPELKMAGPYHKTEDGGWISAAFLYPLSAAADIIDTAEAIYKANEKLAQYTCELRRALSDLYHGAPDNAS